jgi:hypothetical protein
VRVVGFLLPAMRRGNKNVSSDRICSPGLYYIVTCICTSPTSIECVLQTAGVRDPAPMTETLIHPSSARSATTRGGGGGALLRAAGSGAFGDRAAATFRPRLSLGESRDYQFT